MDKLDRIEFHEYFTKGVRSDGASFYKCVDGEPEELWELIRDIHRDYFFDCSPNDWIYETVRDAFLELAENELENCLIEADPYYQQLHRWLEQPYAQEYCAEVMEEGFISEKETNIYNIIAVAQWKAKERIYHVVNDFIRL